MKDQTFTAKNRDERIQVISLIPEKSQRNTKQREYLMWLWPPLFVYRGRETQQGKREV